MGTFKTYSERVLTPSPVVLGLRLRPFTLGHSILLKRHQSKFIVGDLKECGSDGEIIYELVFAALVCSTTYDDFLKEVSEGTFEKNAGNYIKWFCKQAGLKKKTVLSRVVSLFKKSKPFNLIGEVGIFCNYLKNGTTPPLSYPKKSDNVNNSPIEIEEAMISTLMQEYGYSRDECLNLPLTETLSAYLLHAHKQGVIDLIGKEEWELRQQMKGTK